jgi:hypothetical protein
MVRIFGPETPHFLPNFEEILLRDVYANEKEVGAS